MNEDEESKKMAFINENIIEKGYNPEEVANFVMKTIGIPFESLSLEKLKEMLDQYKDKGLNDVYTSVRQNEKKSEKKNESKNKSKKIEDLLYLPEKFEFETDYQQENKLIELDRNNNLIDITVSEPLKEGKNGFFSKAYMTYRIKCPQLNSDVRRTYTDLEWFRNQLVIRYPLRYIPPIIKEIDLKQMENNLNIENEDLYEQRKVRYLNQFFNSLIKKKILRTSPILLEFLVLENEIFKKYQNQLNSKKYELYIKLDNLITMKGKIKCELKPDSINEADKMQNTFNSLSDLYNKIGSCASIISKDFQNLNIHINELSVLFNKLDEILSQNKCNNTNDMKQLFSDFGKIFNNWSNSFGKQNEYYNKEFKETFNYLGFEINEMNSIYKNYKEFKTEYETFTTLIIKKKEDLFNSKKTQNWGVEPGTEGDIPTYKNNKEVAFEKMLYKENILLKEEKKRVSATIHLMNKQFNKLMNNQNERMKKYYEFIKKNSKMIFGGEQMLKELLEKYN